MEPVPISALPLLPPRLSGNCTLDIPRGREITGIIMIPAGMILEEVETRAGAVGTPVAEEGVETAAEAVVGAAILNLGREVLPVVAQARGCGAEARQG